MIFPNGVEAWIINGRFHREDGPAIFRPVYPIGSKERTEYWLNDMKIGALSGKEIYGKENIEKYLILM
jgi:hypothetical protein